MKINKFFLLLLSSIVITSNYSRTREKNSLIYSQAIEKAAKLIDQLSLEPNELQHTREFVEFYASWYAPVTPAPYVLRESLSPQACNFINDLKKIARPFERTMPTRRMGASRLTPEGKDFYREVLRMLAPRKS